MRYAPWRQIESVLSVLGGMLIVAICGVMFLVGCVRTIPELPHLAHLRWM